MNSTFCCLYLLLISVGNLGNVINSNDKQELEIEKILNSSIDPCTNFYKFSCKNWISTVNKPSYEVLWNHWHASANIVNTKLRSILQQSSSEMQSFKKAQSMYFACLNATREDRTDELALLINGVGGWFLPKNNCKVASQYRWPMKVAQITKFANIHPLLKLHVEVDFENRSRHILYVDSGDLVMPAYILEDPENHIQELLKYKEWIIGTAKLMYPTEKMSLNLNEDVDDIIAFEIQLAKLASTDNKRKLVTIDELIEKTNSIDWLNVFKILFDGVDVELGRNNSIVVSWPFVEKLTELLKITKPTIISNYITWHLIKELSRDTSPQLRHLNFQINSAILGIEEDYPPDYECTAKTGEYFQFTLAARYVDLFLTQKIISEVKRMAAEIKSEFVATLKRSNWLNKLTIKKSIEKISAVKIWIGYPKWLTNSNAVEQFYKSVNENLYLFLSSINANSKNFFHS